MTYTEFRDKYNGQYVDVDYFPKEWPYQCFDLAQLYFQEVLNVPDYVLAGCGVVKNMIEWDWKHDQLMEYFDEVSVYEMNQGDVCIWTEGDAGHIAIEDSWDGNSLWFFSQNPNPCQVMQIDMGGLHAFRRKKETPPLPPVTPNVERDENINQVEVKESTTELRVRTQPTTTSDILGIAGKKYYNYYEKVENEGYTWYKIAENQWIANGKDEEEWLIELPATQYKEEYIKLEDYINKYGYGNIDLNKVYIKEEVKS